LDSPSVTLADSVQAPEFSEPSSTTTTTTQSDTNSEDISSTTKKGHPMPDYQSEIDEMVNDIMPLYVGLWAYDNDQETRKLFAETAIANVQRFRGYLDEDKFEHYMDSLVDYIDDWASYYIEHFGINDDMKAAKSITPDFAKQLENPYNIFNAAYDASLTELAETAQREEADAQANNINAMSQLMLVLSLLGGIILMVMILLVFKVENSIRRHADAIEKEASV